MDYISSLAYIGLWSIFAFGYFLGKSA